MVGIDIRFIEADIESCSTFIEEYKQHISIPYDDFLEDIIIASQFSLIDIASQTCGFLGINNSHLTILYIDDIYFSQGIRIFEKIKKILSNSRTRSFRLPTSLHSQLFWKIIKK